MKNGGIFALVFGAMMNFLFFLVIHKNASYQYLMSSDILVFFVMMKLSFGGFALGLLLRRFLAKRDKYFPGKGETLGILAYLSLGIFLVLNILGTPSPWRRRFRLCCVVHVRFRSFSFLGDSLLPAN